MDTAQLEQDLNEQIRQATEAAAAERRVERVNGPASAAAMPLDRLEAEIGQVLDLRSKLKERCRTCAALIIEIERAL